MTTAYIRPHLEKEDKKEKSNRQYKTKRHTSPYLFIFDTETTTDIKQNLKVGCFAVFENITKAKEFQFFYHPAHCTKEELEVLENYCTKHNITLCTHEQFIRKYFYHYLLFKRSLCVGFNLPFDFARVAIDCSFAKGNRYHNGFSFSFSENTCYPRLKIQSNGLHASIEWGTAKYNKYPAYSGRFLDLRTLGIALSDDKHLTLASAADLFNADEKKAKTETYGVITSEFLDYLVQDIKTTHATYRAMVQEFEKYTLSMSTEDVYSSASLGKQLLKQLGIKTFREQNTEFSNDVLGYVMNTYFGGRSEVQERKNPKECCVLDFTSMYPTANILMELDKLLIAERIEVKEETALMQELLDTITREELQNPKMYPTFCGIAEIIPDGDALPLRTNFNKDEPTLNIGICNIESTVPLWYTIPDLVASKILTGETPKIKHGLRFSPVGIQEGINPTTVLGLPLDARKENIYIKLVNERNRLRRERNTHPKESDEYRQLDSVVQALKIIINSNCYGIFIETNPEHFKSRVTAHGIETFTTEEIFEQQGSFYHPIIATLTTGMARLFLAIVESILIEKGMAHAFCDTDSMAVPKEAVKDIQDFFKPLNPYDKEVELLKEEYTDVLCYGISAKRYVLYQWNGKDIEIIKHSLHGLGHLLNPFGDSDEPWHHRIWKDIIRLHHGIITQEQFNELYSHVYAIAKLAIRTQHLWNHAKKLNNGKSYDEQIKPFNFMLTGFVTNDHDGIPVKPLSPYSKNASEAVYKPFTEANTGKLFPADLAYWLSLADTLNKYIDHPESKFEGDTGLLKRRTIKVDNFAYCGKEAKNIDLQVLQTQKPTVYKRKMKLIDMRTLTSEERRKLGISRQKASYWRKKN